MEGLGYKGPDEKDNRDRPFAALATATEGTPPDDYSLRKYIPNVLRQRDLGSCVVHGFVQGVRMCQIRNDVLEIAKLEETDPDSKQEVADALRLLLDNPPELSSRLFGYYNSRVQHGDEKNDSGTFIRLTIKQANRLGRPPESVWPYDLSDSYTPDATWKQRPVLQAYQFASDFKPAKYHRIFEEGPARVDPIKRSIALAKSPVLFGTEIGDSMRVTDGRLIHPPIAEQIVGGHAMLFVGYDKDGPWAVNSWGEGAGEDGFMHLSWDYVVWKGMRDLWAIDL